MPVPLTDVRVIPHFQLVGLACSFSSSSRARPDPDALRFPWPGKPEVADQSRQVSQAITIHLEPMACDITARPSPCCLGRRMPSTCSRIIMPKVTCEFASRPFSGAFESDPRHRNDSLVQYEFQEITAALKLDSLVGWKTLMITPGNRRRFMVIVALAFFSQVHEHVLHCESSLNVFEA